MHDPDSGRQSESHFTTHWNSLELLVQILPPVLETLSLPKAYEAFMKSTKSYRNPFTPYQRSNTQIIETLQEPLYEKEPLDPKPRLDKRILKPYIKLNSEKVQRTRIIEPIFEPWTLGLNPQP